MQNEPDLSIIIPYYNGEKYIDKLLRSISDSHNFYNKIAIEVILIIDSMNTSIVELKQQIHEFIEPLSITIYKNEVNLGVAGTRNFGIERARGMYVHFIDQDDELIPSFFIEIENKGFRKFDFILMNGVLTYGDGFSCRIFYLPPILNFKTLVTDDFIRSPGQVIIRKALLKKEMRFPVPVEHHGSDDKFFYMTIFKLSDPLVLYINSTLYKANIHDNNYSNDQQESIASSLELFEQFKAQYGLSKNENYYFDYTINTLLYRSGKLSGIKKLWGMLFYLSYKFKLNKCIRYSIRLTKL